MDDRILHDCRVAITRFALEALITFLRFAAWILSASSSSTQASSRRLRQRVSLDGSTGGSVCKYVSPVKTWTIRVLYPLPDHFLVRQIERMLEIQQPSN